MEAFAGKFKSVWSENFDEYMKKVGVGFALRKMAEMATPVVEIFKEGEMWHLKTTTTFKTTEIIFKLGEEFDETTGDGRLVKTTVTIEDGKMYQRQKATKANEKESEIIRWMEDGDNMTTTVQCEDVKSTRKYKREP